MTVDRDTNSQPSTEISPSTKASALSVLGSTLTSLAIVLGLLLVVRWLLPPLLESSRYSWYRGQLRAEHEAAKEQLRNVSLDGLSRVSQLVSQRVTPSVVHIEVKQEYRWGERAKPSELLDSQRLKLNGQGSGVLVDPEGYIVTNFHVLEGGESIEIRFSDKSQGEATIVGIDRARDLAVVKVPPVDLPAMAWGDSDMTSVGSPVWAIGSPFGLHGSVTFGILSSKHRVDLRDSYYSTSGRVQAEYSDLMQSDVAVNPGNSGGPLVNGQGELIGINTAIVGDTFQGVSFSIPSNLAKQLYEEIREKAKSPKGWLGVHLRSTDSNQVDGNNEPNSASEAVASGAVVGDFARLGISPARQAGIQAGDVITAIDDQVIKDHLDLIDEIASRLPGTEVRLSILRDDQKKSVSVKLGSRFVELDVQ